MNSNDSIRERQIFFPSSTRPRLAYNRAPRSLPDPAQAHPISSYSCVLYASPLLNVAHDSPRLPHFNHPSYNAFLPLPDHPHVARHGAREELLRRAGIYNGQHQPPSYELGTLERPSLFPHQQFEPLLARRSLSPVTKFDSVPPTLLSQSTSHRFFRRAEESADGAYVSGSTTPLFTGPPQSHFPFSPFEDVHAHLDPDTIAYATELNTLLASPLLFDSPLSDSLQNFDGWSTVSSEWDSVSTDQLFSQALLPIPAPTLTLTAPTKTKAPGRGKKEAPLPMDAPVQPRKYVTSSATSRKRRTVPIERELAKRTKSSSPANSPAPSQVADDLPPDLLRKVEKKRLSNTLSARKSRAAKANVLEELRTENEQLRGEVEMLKMRLAALERAGL